MAITLDGTSGITSPTLDSTGTTTISTNNVALRLKDSSGSLYEAIKATSSNQLQLSSGGASSSYLFYANAGTLKLRIDNDGLKFNSDTAAANALDDYEEGTWTMALSDGTNSAGSATGYYTKIGNMVFVRGFIGNVNTSALTNTSNDLIITGLPFATSSSKNGNQRTSGTVSVDNVTFNGYLTCETGYGSNTELRLLENNSGSSGDRLEVNQYTSGSGDIWIEVTYPTES